MIDTIRAKNYMCFKNAEVECELVNVFVGENNHGKTDWSVSAPKGNLA